MYDTNSKCKINPGELKLNLKKKDTINLKRTSRLLDSGLNRECVLDAVAESWFNLDQVQQELNTPMKMLWKICNDSIGGNSTFESLY